MSIQKSWAELDEEGSVHGREVARARLRCRVDPDPRALIAGVCAGRTAASEIARPRWRSLAEQIERAELCSAQRAALRELVDAVRRRGDLLLAEGAFGGARHPFVDGLVALCRRHAQWIRAPREWRARSHNARRQFASLARHLVARYPVPAFLDAAWLRCDEAAERYRDWFVQIGSGGSIRHSTAPIAMTSRIAHYFLRAPESYSIEQALRWGQVHALGGDPALADALIGTRLDGCFQHEDFWITVIRYFAARPELDRVHVGPIVDYLHNQRYEARDVFVAPGVRAQLPPPQPNLSMKGRSLDALLRQVDRWHRALARGGPGANLRWDRCAIGEFELETGVRERNLRVWRIRELLSAAELRHEGTVMRHCVASYARSCAERRISIWTMELWGFEGTHKRQTIEVRDRVIVQCRGRFNASPNTVERQILARWASQEGLQLARVL